MSSSYKEPYQYVNQDYSQYPLSMYSYHTSQSSPSLQYSAPLAAAQYTGQSTPAAQYTAQSTPAAQYTGQSAPAAQYTGQSAPAAQYTGQSTPAGQYTGQSTPAAQYTGQSTTAAQYTGQSTPAAQYTGQSTTAAQYTGQSTPAAQYTGQSTTAAQYSETAFSSSLQYSDPPPSSDLGIREQYGSGPNQAYNYASSTSDYYSQLQQAVYPGSYKTAESASGNGATFEYHLGARQAPSTQSSVQYPYGDVHSAGQQAEAVDSYISSGLSTTLDTSSSYSSQVPQSTVVSTPFASQQNQHMDMPLQSPLSAGQTYGAAPHNYTGARYSVADAHVISDNNSSYSSATQLGYSDNIAAPSEGRPYGASSSPQENFGGFSKDQYHTANDTTNKYVADPYYGSGSGRQQFWMHNEQYSQGTSADDDYDYSNRYASKSEQLAQTTPEGQHRGCVGRPRNNLRGASLCGSTGQGTFPKETGYVQSEGQGKGSWHREPWQHSEKYSSWTGSSNTRGRAGLNVNRQRGQQQRGRGRGGGFSHVEERPSFHGTQSFDGSQGSSFGPRGFGLHNMGPSKERTVGFPRGGFQGGRNRDFSKFGGSQNYTRFSGKTGFGSSQMLATNRQQDARRSGSNSDNRNSGYMDSGFSGGNTNRSQNLNTNRAKLCDVGKAQNKGDSVPVTNKGTQKGSVGDVEDKLPGKGSEKQALVQQKSASGNPLPGDKTPGTSTKSQASKADKTGQTSQTKSGAAQSGASLDKRQSSSIHSVESKSPDSHHSDSSTSVNNNPGTKSQVSSAKKTAPSTCSVNQESGQLEVTEASSSAPTQRNDDAVPKRKSDDVVHREKIPDEGQKDETERKECSTIKPGMTKEEIEREQEIQRKIRESVVALVVSDQPTEEDIQNMFDPPPSVEVPDHLVPKLKALLTQTHCDLCSLTLNAVQQAVQHYKGKNHTKRVRLFVSSNGNYSAAKVADNSAGATTAAAADATKAMVLASASLARPGHADSEGASGTTTTVVSEAETPEEEKKQATGEEREYSKEDYCALCGVSFTSIKQSEQHYSGKNHAKKQRMADASKLMAEIADNDMVKKGENNVYECTLCNVFVTSHEQFSTHLKGFKHQNKMRQSEGRQHLEKSSPFGRGRGPLRGRLAHGGGRGGMRFGRVSGGAKRASNFSSGREQDRQLVIAERETRDKRGTWTRGRSHSHQGAAHFLPAADFMREDFQRNSFESREHKGERYGGPGLWERDTWGFQGHLMAPNSMPASGLEGGWGQGDVSRPVGGKRTGRSLHEFGGPRGKRPRRGF